MHLDCSHLKCGSRAVFEDRTLGAIGSRYSVLIFGGDPESVYWLRRREHECDDLIMN